MADADTPDSEKNAEQPALINMDKKYGKKKGKNIFYIKKDGTSLLDMAIFLRFAISLLFGLIGYNFKYVTEPARRGFWCSDISIRLPFHESSIEVTTIFFVAIPFTIIMMCIGEFIFNNSPSGCKEQFKIHIISWRARQIAQFTSIFLLGLAVNIFVYNIFKYSLGSLRPNFIDVCKPKYKEQICSLQFSEFNLYFRPDYECTTDDKSSIHDAKLSFYSGHSAISFFFATFIIIYSHLRITLRYRYKTQLLPFSIIFYSLLLSCAGFLASTRISDNKHHPIDVFVGAIAGTALAALIVFLHKEIFIERASPVQEPTTRSTIKTIGEEDGNVRVA